MSVFNPVQLIDEIKKRPGLYKADHPTDREEKLALWKEIGSVIYQGWEDFNKATAYDRVLQLQRKWRSLRDAYNRELRARRSGIRINRRVYRYFKRMSFLGGFEGSLSADEELDEDIMLEAQIPEEALNIETVKVKKVKREKKKRKRESSEGSHQPTEELEMPMFPMEIAETETDSDRLFLLSFLPEMRQLPINIKMWVRAQIANVMQEAVSCHYNNTTPGTSSDKNFIDIKRPRHDSTE
ncbi:uncharacterized protein LOC110377020 [Helicoverpa armigera]|uniref:BESS domain-containing protein n=1 Tax=Helicoverpa armigera TaxID=29058 RepID=A0A2W1BS85_HELAM|nr:uncharacterized protein LOC110377020 isoform X2 [Helicoverpa armigera]XP_047032917.1 uncharacterized protein LOC124639541 isoform X1 [Helicoverpa zea]PZC77191.1 hypothetical protein B5X24_HaOG203669 [Helicoverpa armigera]